ncbi:MAG: hypothetical protein DRP78_02430 [Candidatus Omnitrophota bacterium]|nr:MAG: hypothetical protein DRP78_02430 [Candidatus Omnitrophota bacterium]
MICRIRGKIIQKNENSILIDVNGLGYDLLMPQGVLKCLKVDRGNVEFVTFHYLHIEHSRSIPILIGFLNEVEKEFFEKIITVSGIGPKAAVRAINEPIAEIARAIDCEDIKFLKSLPGIGQQKARQIIAKLQGKVGKFALIQSSGKTEPEVHNTKSGLIAEAVSVLLQLQYKKQEAERMVKEALERNLELKNSEELLNEVYKQRVKHK